MKSMFMFLVMMFAVSTSNAQVSEFFCKRVPKDSFKAAGKVAVGCAKVIPADALDYVFKTNSKSNETEITKFEAKELNDKTRIAVLGTRDHAFYLRLNDKKQIVKLQQGFGNGTVAPHCYDYEIKDYDGVRYCNAAPPKDSAECLKKWAHDPIRNPKGKTKSCEVFLSALQKCSDSDTTGKCVEQIYEKMYNVSTTEPRPNPYNKPMPGSDQGIAESDDEFCGEPDQPACRERKGVAPTPRARGAR